MRKKATAKKVLTEVEYKIVIDKIGNQCFFQNDDEVFCRNVGKPTSKLHQLAG